MEHTFVTGCIRNCPVPFSTLNIPKPDKNLLGADAALCQLRAALCVAWQRLGQTGDECRFAGPDGPAWIAAVRMLDAMIPKQLAVEVEENHVLGRLADADVMDSQGQPVNREHLAGTPTAVDGGAAQRRRAPRQCFLCPGQPACAVARAGTALKNCWIWCAQHVAPCQRSSGAGAAMSAVMPLPDDSWGEFLMSSPLHGRKVHGIFCPCICLARGRACGAGGHT